LVSSSLDDTVCLWDVASGRKLQQLPGHGRSGGARAVVFAPDGEHFLSWGDDLYLRKWDVSTGKAVLEYQLRPTGVDVPGKDDAFKARFFMMNLGEGTFSPDGKTFVVYVGGSFHVFDVASGKDLRQIPNEGGRVLSLTISPDSQRLLASAWGKPVLTKLTDGRMRSSAGKDHPVCLWGLSSGKLLKKIVLPEGGAGPVAFSADGQYFAMAINEAQPCIRLCRVDDGREVRTIRGYGHRARALAFSPDGLRLIVGLEDTTALVWDLTDKR
jgi:WD40 repeat protein